MFRLIKRVFMLGVLLLVGIIALGIWESNHSPAPSSSSAPSVPSVNPPDAPSVAETPSTPTPTPSPTAVQVPIQVTPKTATPTPVIDELGVKLRSARVQASLAAARFKQIKTAALTKLAASSEYQARKRGSGP